MLRSLILLIFMFVALAQASIKCGSEVNGVVETMEECFDNHCEFINDSTDIKCYIDINGYKTSHSFHLKSVERMRGETKYGDIEYSITIIRPNQ